MLWQWHNENLSRIVAYVDIVAVERQVATSRLIIIDNLLESLRIWWFEELRVYLLNFRSLSCDLVMDHHG